MEREREEKEEGRAEGGEGESSLVSLQGLKPIGLGPILMTSFNTNNSLQAMSSPNIVTFGVRC